MGVRRLAGKDVQPESFAFSPENAAWAEQQLTKYPPGRQASAVIPLLSKAQDQEGWLTEAAIVSIADMLEMPKIRVLEVATFYTMFALGPVGEHFVQVCGTTPCGLRGAKDIIAVCEQRIGPRESVTADGKFSWIEVECLGACCNAPMVQIGTDYFEDLTPANFAQVLDDLAAGKDVKVGSQIGRRSSEPEGGPDALTDPALYDGSRLGAWRHRFEESHVADPAAPAPQVSPSAPEAKAENAAKPDPTQRGEEEASRSMPTDGTKVAVPGTGV